MLLGFDAASASHNEPIPLDYYGKKLTKYGDASAPPYGGPSMAKVLLCVGEIRRLRKADKQDGYPEDLGCETQIYLGCAIRKEYPSLRDRHIAAACLVPRAQSDFFAELLDLAENANWMKPEIMRAARNALRGA